MSTRLEPIGRMSLYGPEHLCALALAVVVGIVFVWGARRIAGTVHEDRALRISGWTVLAITLGWMCWDLLPGNWNIDQSLPFHYSDVLRIITAIALIRRAGWAIAISYFWGLTLNIQSVLTPDLNYFTVPVLEYLLFWYLHIVVLLAPIVLTWGFGYRPTWRGYGIAYSATIAWACVAVTVNGITGANYAYLSRPPQGPSLLDLLGDWPVYVFWEALAAAVLWALMTLPWTLWGHRGASITDSSGAVRRRPPSPRPPRFARPAPRPSRGGADPSPA
ncbi:TIGR02206 family membrane protein [Brevibacterium album]|uniref:YwaF family protein n=1 Tax=Brevibacterium album TaxID=417948 RepID=UPI00041829F7|nr:TIGR02206 family membrane protein [Brevibacterium album]